VTDIGTAGTSVTTPPGAVWDGVVGQPAAISRLRAAAAHGPVHAYLFVGPAGSTKLQAARAFATLLLTGQEEPDHRDARLILRGEHPDVREVRRTGAAISKEQADEIVRESALTPSEGSAKVMILDEFHLLAAPGAARLLKTIEEPPPSTTFLILADFVPSDLITIASRCARVDFRAISPDVVAARLVA
jgi:DNA polymerase III subunit delta'